MSVLLMGKAFYADLPSHLRLTLLAVADCADDDGTSIHIGQKHLGLKIGASDRTVRQNMGQLVDLGYLREIPREGPRGVNRYEIVVESLPSDGDIKLLKVALRDPRPETSSGRPQASTEVDRKPTAGIDRKPTSAVDRKPTSYKPSDEPSDQPSEKSLAPTSSARPADLIFEALWLVCYGAVYDAAVVQIPPTARGMLNRAVAELKAAGARPEQIAQVPEAWVTLWPGRQPPTCTAPAIVKHWPALVAVIDRGYVARGQEQSDVADLRRALEEASA